MGLLDRLQNGVAAGAQTASEAFMTQFKSQVEQERQEALIRAQEASRLRTAEAEAGIQLNTRQKSFEQDEANSGLLRTRKVADEQAVGQVRNTLERDAAKNKLTDEFEFKKKNAKDIAGIERMIAQARHITDPNIDLVQNGDGTYMRYDKRAGKSLGVLTDPATGKPFVGAKDVSKATLEVAQSMAKEGLELMKDPMNPEGMKEGRALLEQSRTLILGRGEKQNPKSFDAMFPVMNNQSDTAKTSQPQAAAPAKQSLLSPAERKAAASTEVTAADIERNKQAVAEKKKREADAEAVREEERRKKNEKRDKEREAMNRLSRIRD